MELPRPYLYTIRCAKWANEERTAYCIYDVGLFSSFEEAEKYMPDKKAFHFDEFWDARLETTIHASVRVFRWEELSAAAISELDKPVFVGERMF